MRVFLLALNFSPVTCVAHLVWIPVCDLKFLAWSFLRSPSYWMRRAGRWSVVTLGYLRHWKPKSLLLPWRGGRWREFELERGTPMKTSANWLIIKLRQRPYSGILFGKPQMGTKDETKDSCRGYENLVTFLWLPLNLRHLSGDKGSRCCTSHDRPTELPKKWWLWIWWVGKGEFLSLYVMFK